VSDDDAPSFYFVPADWLRECSTESLPRMQELRDVLKKMKTAIASAFNGDDIMKLILFSSHRCGKTRVSPI
jgi:hypothetical protein